VTIATTRRRRTFLLVLAGAAAAIMAAFAVPADNLHYNPDKPHHTPTGFRNNYSNPEPGNFWKWQLERWENGVPAIPDGGWTFPVDKPDAAYLRANRSETTVTWIGHATLLLQVGGLNILTDPVWSERASPFTFLGPKRWVPPALPLDELPPIDIVLVSHNHYDHLDEATVEHLARQPGGAPRFYVPLGVDAWFRDRGLPVHATMDWWDRRDDGALAVHFVPAQHWSARSWWDRNETLWGGFVVEAPGFRFIYTGDTGYSQDFADIRRRFGSFDLAAMPIGSYEPRWFMEPVHVNPAEAVQIHRDLDAARSLGVHWGTFLLTDEPLDEPPRKLDAALSAAGLTRDEFWVFRHGEVRTLGTAAWPRAAATPASAAAGTTR
jgi:L-ascorbate metabolism protein UlaG (beta-lactamase superfamily)